MSDEAVKESVEEEIDLDFVRGVLDKYKDTRGSLIPILQSVQVNFGYVPKEAMYLISETLRMPLAHLVGVASFYAQFRMTPRGKYMMKICCGTACHVKGAQKLVEKATEILNIHHGETTEDKLVTMERVACIGACSLAPVITVNEEAEGYLDVDKFEAVLDKLTDEDDEEEAG